VRNPPLWRSYNRAYEPRFARGVLHLYLVMNVWSRKFVTWRIAEDDSAQVAATLITQARHNSTVDRGRQAMGRSHPLVAWPDGPQTVTH
jgi:hypothetical protein